VPARSKLRRLKLTRSASDMVFSPNIFAPFSGADGYQTKRSKTRLFQNMLASMESYAANRDHIIVIASIKVPRHGRACCSGHPRLFLLKSRKDVDARDI
jgi:hypothetical protein